MTTFDGKIEALSHRVDQILRYHKIKIRDDDEVEGTRATMGVESKTEPKVIAHFTSWPSCMAILDGAQKGRGLSLWAGDATCFNDPLEGRALIKFAEEYEPASKPVFSTSVDGWPHLESQIALASRNGGGLPIERLDHLREIMRRLCGYVPPSASGWSVPRRLPPLGIYLVSFCRVEDRLDLWRAYGERAQGVCMVMPLDDAARAIGPEWTVYRVARARTRSRGRLQGQIR